MIQSLYPYIILLMGIILYYKKPLWVVFYWLMIPCVVLPLFTFLTFSVSKDVMTQMVNSTFVGTRNLFLVLLVLSFIKRGEFPKMYRLLLMLGIISLYFMFHSTIFLSGFGILWGNISEVVSQILPLLYFYNERKHLPSVNSLFKFIVVLLGIELFCVLLNSFGLYFYLSAYVPDFTVSETGRIVFDDESLISGTFTRYNAMANYITTIYLFVALEYFANKSITKKHFYFLSFVVGVIILLSGAKMSVAIWALTIIGGTMFFPKGNKSILVSSIVGFLLVFTFLKSFDFLGKDVSDNEGLNRVVNGLASFVQSDKDDDQSTVGLSSYLLDNFLYDGFFLGNGLTKMGEMAYGNWGSCTLTHFRADARMAYNLVEFGIVGFVLYFIFFFSTCTTLNRRLKYKNKKKIWFCFLYFFILTVTEPGFFDRTCFPMLFLYLCVCLLPQKRKRAKNANLIDYKNETNSTAVI